MEIIGLNNKDLSLLDAFKAEEWPGADQEHYGNSKPDFSRHKYTLVAKDGEKILGYLSFSVDAGIALIESMIVGKNYRNQGIAKQLMSVAENKIKTLGAHKVWLETGADWDAKYLYEKLGYKIRTNLPNHYGHREFVLMDKEL